MALTWLEYAGVSFTRSIAPGQLVGPAFDNADRIGCFMVANADRRRAEMLADAAVAETMVELMSADRMSATMS